MVAPNGYFNVNMISKVQALIGNMPATASNAQVSDQVVFIAVTTVNHVMNLTSNLNKSKVKTSWNISILNRGNLLVFLLGSVGDSCMEAASVELDANAPPGTARAVARHSSNKQSQARLRLYEDRVRHKDSE